MQIICILKWNRKKTILPMQSDYPEWRWRCECEQPNERMTNWKIIAQEAAIILSIPFFGVNVTWVYPLVSTYKLQLIINVARVESSTNNSNEEQLPEAYWLFGAHLVDEILQNNNQGIIVSPLLFSAQLFIMEKNICFLLI